MLFFFYFKKKKKKSSDLSLKDWDVKEQEHLREVETILDRTDEILEVMRFFFFYLCVLNLESTPFFFFFE